MLINKTELLEDLSNRTARCRCCQAQVESRKDLAFFEYRGAGSKDARHSCKHCGYYECAHQPQHMETLAHNRDGSRRPTVVESGICKGGGFEPQSSSKFDTYYCGCRGWD